MRLAYLGAVLVALVITGCPANNLTFPGGVTLPNGGTGGTGADRLAFTVQPSSAARGNIITPAVQVAARDSFGNVDAAFTNNITVSINVNPVGGVLSGTLTVTPVNGVALFGDLTINQSGAGYSLRATAANAVSASSASFTITQ